MQTRRVLIIGITELQEAGINCVCGFDLDTGRGVRLCPSSDSFSAPTRPHLWSERAAASNFTIGQVWELTGTPGHRQAPWGDDFVVEMGHSTAGGAKSPGDAYAELQSLPDLARGPLEDLFEGKLLQLTQNPNWRRGDNHFYDRPGQEGKKTVARTVDVKKGGAGHPVRSIVLWECHRDLRWWTSSKSFAYEVVWNSYIMISPLIGSNIPEQTIPAGSIVGLTLVPHVPRGVTTDDYANVLRIGSVYLPPPEPPTAPRFRPAPSPTLPSENGPASTWLAATPEEIASDGERDDDHGKDVWEWLPNTPEGILLALQERNMSLRDIVLRLWWTSWRGQKSLEIPSPSHPHRDEICRLIPPLTEVVLNSDEHWGDSVRLLGVLRTFLCGERAGIPAETTTMLDDWIPFNTEVLDGSDIYGYFRPALASSQDLCIVWLDYWTKLLRSVLLSLQATHVDPDDLFVVEGGFGFPHRALGSIATCLLMISLVPEDEALEWLTGNQAMLNRHGSMLDESIKDEVFKWFFAELSPSDFEATRNLVELAVDE